MLERRRLEKQRGLIQGKWLNEWLDWGRLTMLVWKQADPQFKARHDELFVPLYREWAAAVLAGEFSTFLSRGGSLAKWWDTAPLLWLWQWQVLQGWLEEDLRQWPKQVVGPPQIPDGVLTRLVAEAQTPEDFALLLAVCAARVGRSA